MTYKINKNSVLKFIIAIGLLSLTSLVATSFAAPVKKTSAPLGGMALATCYSGGSSTATSTTFMLDPNPSSNNGTTTVICDVGGTDLFDVNIFGVATNSLAVLAWNKQYATDFPNTNFLRGNGNYSLATSSIISDITWYTDDCLADVQTNVLRPHANVCTETMSLSSTTNAIASQGVSKNISYITPAERYLRLNFSTVNSTSTVNVRIVKRVKTL